MKYGDGQDSTHLSWASGAVTGASGAVTGATEAVTPGNRGGDTGQPRR